MDCASGGSECFHQLGAEVQTVSLYAHDGASLSAGGFELTFDGETTACVDYDSSDADIEAALELLNNVDDVIVRRTGITYPGNGFEWQITFSGFGVYGDVAQITAAESGCTAMDPATFSFAESTVMSGDSLQAGTAYYVRVSPVNSVGTGTATASSPASLIPRSPPTAPLNVEVNSVSDDETKLRVKWDAPASNEGAEITSYTIEWDSAADNYDSSETFSVTGTDLTDAAAAHPAEVPSTIPLTLIFRQELFLSCVYTGLMLRVMEIWEMLHLCVKVILRIVRL